MHYKTKNYIILTSSKCHSVIQTLAFNILVTLQLFGIQSFTKKIIVQWKKLIFSDHKFHLNHFIFSLHNKCIIKQQKTSF